MVAIDYLLVQARRRKSDPDLPPVGDQCVRKTGRESLKDFADRERAHMPLTG
jgi:hypothetical protein